MEGGRATRLVEESEAVELVGREAGDHPVAAAELLQILVGDDHGQLEDLRAAPLVGVVEAVGQLEVEEDDVEHALGQLLILGVARLAVAVLEARIHAERLERGDGLRLLIKDGEVEWRTLVRVALHVQVETERRHGLQHNHEAPRRGGVHELVLVLVAPVAPCGERLEAVRLDQLRHGREPRILGRHEVRHGDQFLGHGDQLLRHDVLLLRHGVHALCSSCVTKTPRKEEFGVVAGTLSIGRGHHITQIPKAF